jgi:hypothetical protein
MHVREIKFEDAYCIYLTGSCERRNKYLSFIKCTEFLEVTERLLTFCWKPCSMESVGLLFSLVQSVQTHDFLLLFPEGNAKTWVWHTRTTAWICKQGQLWTSERFRSFGNALVQNISLWHGKGVDMLYGANVTFSCEVLRSAQLCVAERSRSMVMNM